MPSKRLSEPPAPPPILAATRALLADEAPVWVPLRTPSPFLCKCAFHPPGFRPDGAGHSKIRPHDGTLADTAHAMGEAGTDPRRQARTDDRGFRVQRWLKATGDLVVKNEPIAVVDASRARRNSVFAGLDLPDPMIFAPESGELVWQDRSDQPHRVFGLIRTTNGLIDANMDHPIRSELVPFADAVAGRLLHRSVAWRRKLRLFDGAGLNYLAGLGLAGRKEALEMGRRNSFSWCHGLWWPTPPANYRAPGWGKATDFEKAALRKAYAGPASAQYDDAWFRTVEALRWEGFDPERMGVGFALPFLPQGATAPGVQDHPSLAIGSCPP